MILTIYWDARPFKLSNVDKGLVDVRVGSYKEGCELQGKRFGLQNILRLFRLHWIDA